MNVLRAPILYVAPGAGLGHLVRACAICLLLHKEGIPTRIVTNSPYAEGLGRITGCAMDTISSSRWIQDIPAYAACLGPRMVVLDTFPWGIRGEWKNMGRDHRFVVVARRLKVPAYLQAAGVEWDVAAPHVRRIIQAEPLPEDYLALLRKCDGDVRELPGRVRFPAEDYPTPVPSGLGRLLETRRVWLVVHTGPKHELESLVHLAQFSMGTQSGDAVAAIVPRSSGRQLCPTFEYFPAARLYGLAHRVVTGGGYGCLADMSPWSHRHLCTPFVRRYDDQAGRLHGAPAGTENGAAEAARILADWL